MLRDSIVSVIGLIDRALVKSGATESLKKAIISPLTHSQVLLSSLIPNKEDQLAKENWLHDLHAGRFSNNSQQQSWIREIANNKSVIEDGLTALKADFGLTDAIPKMVSNLLAFIDNLVKIQLHEISSESDDELTYQAVLKDSDIKMDRVFANVFADQDTEFAPENKQEFLLEDVPREYSKFADSFKGANQQDLDLIVDKILEPEFWAVPDDAIADLADELETALNARIDSHHLDRTFPELDDPDFRE